MQHRVQALPETCLSNDRPHYRTPHITLPSESAPLSQCPAWTSKADVVHTCRTFWASFDYRQVTNPVAPYRQLGDVALLRPVKWCHRYPLPSLNPKLSSRQLATGGKNGKPFVTREAGPVRAPTKLGTGSRAPPAIDQKLSIPSRTTRGGMIVVGDRKRW